MGAPAPRAPVVPMPLVLKSWIYIMYNVVVQWNVGNGDTHPQTQRTSDKRKKCRYWCKFLGFWYILYPGLIPDSVKVGRAPICRQEINRNKIIFKARISISSSCQCLHNPSCSFKCYSMYHSLSKIRPPRFSLQVIAESHLLLESNA